MDKVNIYIMNNSKYFSADKIEFVRGKIASMNEEQYMALSSIDLKDPSTMLLISIFGGGLGIDRFILGDVTNGILKLILMLSCGLGTIWWILDIISIKNRTMEFNFNNFIKQVSIFMNMQTFNSQGEQTFYKASVSNSPVNTIAVSNQHIDTVSSAPETPQATVKTYEPIIGLDTDVLIKRAFIAIEDGKFDDADRYLEQALNQDPENSRAYLGKLMVEKRVHNTDELVKLAQPLDDNKFFKRALRFANEEEKADLQAYAAASRSV